jgi:endonuclease III
LKNATAFARKLASLMRRVRRTHNTEPPDQLEPVTQMVIALLEWNATQKMARDAYDRIMQQMVDHNELRVSYTDELVALLGPEYPQPLEHAQRLRDVLDELFQRERAVTLTQLADRNKKDARQYLDTLPGMVPYAAAQVMLLCFDAHGAPVDDNMLKRLRREEIIDPGATLDEVEAFLMHQIKADKAVEWHMGLKKWSDASVRRQTAAKPQAKTTEKKTKVITKRPASRSRK